MQISFATSQGVGTTNEDGVFAGAGLVVVLDGLSAPSGLPMACSHGTPWFVKQLGTRLLVSAGADELPLQDALSSAIKHVNRLHEDSCDLSQIDVPSTTVAMLRATHNTIEYLVLSDTTIVLDTTSGTEVITDRAVDTVASREATAVRHEKHGSPAHTARVADLVQAQRQLRNQPDGYWVASTDPMAAKHAVTGSVDRRAVHRAALLTDGAARLADPFQVNTWDQVLDILEAQGPNGLILRTRTVETSDANGERWPRFKSHDDATAALCLFEEP